MTDAVLLLDGGGGGPATTLEARRLVVDRAAAADEALAPLEAPIRPGVDAAGRGTALVVAGAERGDDQRLAAHHGPHLAAGAHQPAQEAHAPGPAGEGAGGVPNSADWAGDALCPPWTAARVGCVSSSPGSPGGPPPRQSRSPSSRAAYSQ